MAGQRDRGRGGYLPAGLRRAGHGRGVDSHEQERHARFLGSERKTAAGSQVQLAHRPPAFHYHRPQGRAAQAFHRRAQQRHGVGQDTDQSLARPPSQIAPPFSLKHAAQPRSRARTQPQHRARSAGKGRRHAHGKTGGSRRILDLCRIDLMHPSPRRPADQSIQHGQAETAGSRLQLRGTLAEGKGNDSHVPIMFYSVGRSSRLSPIPGNATCDLAGCRLRGGSCLIGHWPNGLLC